MDRTCSTNGGREEEKKKKKNVYKLLVGEPKGKRQLRRRRHKWVDNIKMKLGEMGWGGVDWIH
jgi:hypothetical protein